jgi:hypothetical protein
LDRAIENKPCKIRTVFGFVALSEKDKERVAAEAKPFGEQVVFTGFDSNNESEHLAIAKFLMNQLDRLTEFKNRIPDSHTHKLDAYKRMLSVFEPLRSNLVGRGLNAAEIVQILLAEIHPSRRK